MISARKRRTRMALQFKVQIQAPPDRVFDYLADVGRHPEWANPKASMRMEDVSGGMPGPGHAYRSAGVFVGKDVTADITVTAFERPRRFAIRSDQHQQGKKDVWYENEFTLIPANGGTLVTKRVTSNGNPVVGFLAYPAIRKDVMTSLGNLKAKLESGATG
jgi:uncharacterized protein YndB with AHSA1/START domain